MPHKRKLFAFLQWSSLARAYYLVTLYDFLWQKIPFGCCCIGRLVPLTYIFVLDFILHFCENIEKTVFLVALPEHVSECSQKNAKFLFLATNGKLNGTKKEHTQRD